MSEVVVVIGPGLIGQAIARRIGIGKHLVLADRRIENANAAAETLSNAGYSADLTKILIPSRPAHVLKSGNGSAERAERGLYRVLRTHIWSRLNAPVSLRALSSI